MKFINLTVKVSGLDGTYCIRVSEVPTEKKD